MGSYVIAFLAASFSAVCAYVLVKAVSFLDPEGTSGPGH